MFAVQGTAININGRTGGTPGPAQLIGARVPMPVPLGRQKLTPSGTTPNAPSTTFARYLRVRNLDAANNLLVSFTDGSQATVRPASSEEFSGTIPWIVVQAVVAPVQWEAFAIVAA